MGDDSVATAVLDAAPAVGGAAGAAAPSRPPAMRSRWLAIPAGPTLIRAFDIVGALGLMVLFAPVALAVAALVKITSRGPVLYASERLAAGGGTFAALKFRSMVIDGPSVLADYFVRFPEARARYEREQKLVNDPRVTRVGRLIRMTSLDELPQLWNVLVGEMSLVGPRPKLPEEAPLYGESLDLVLTVKPGLTGLWQVSGRSAVSYDHRIALDVAYVLNRTLLGDIAICLRTAALLLRPDSDAAY